MNRYVLLGFLVLSFCLPLIEIPQQLSFWRGRENVATKTHLAVSNTNTVLEPPQSEERTLSVTPTFNSKVVVFFQRFLTWVPYIYWFGVIVFGLNYIIQVITLLHVAYTRPQIKDGKYRIIELNNDKGPCCFGNFIFINPSKYDWDVYNEILEHEKIHVRGRHTLDILLAELAIMFQWFNPFAWRYRKVLESNIEFLTDQILVQNKEIDKTSYQFNILKLSARHLPLAITINYNQSLLKSRILMMNLKKSSIKTIWKYFFIPILLLCLMGTFNQTRTLGQKGPGLLNPMDKNVFSLTGQIKDLSNGTILLEYLDKHGKFIADTSVLKDGFFYFTGNISIPTIATIMTASGKEITRIFLEPCRMNATVETSSFTEMHLSGSKSQMEYDTLKELCFPILKESESLEIAYLEANRNAIAASFRKADHTEMDSLDKKVTTALEDLAPSSSKIADIVFQFVDSHPASYVSAYKMSYYTKKWPLESTRRIFNKMSPDIKQSIYGQKIYQAIR